MQGEDLNAALGTGTFKDASDKDLRTIVTITKYYCVVEYLHRLRLIPLALAVARELDRQGN